VPAAAVVVNDERVTSIFALAWTERGVGTSCAVARGSLRPTSPRSTVRAPCERPEHHGRSVSELASADHVDVYTPCDRG
jgi:hypothetical protein